MSYVNVCITRKLKFFAGLSKYSTVSFSPLTNDGIPCMDESNCTIVLAYLFIAVDQILYAQAQIKVCLCHSSNLRQIIETPLSTLQLDINDRLSLASSSQTCIMI